MLQYHHFDALDSTNAYLRLAEAEMSENEKEALTQCATFAEKWKTVWDRFTGHGDTVADKDSMGNLALLDSSTNRSYKNAIFPAKRRMLLLECPQKVYVPPATTAAFAKTYSPAAAQMRYWSNSDSVKYHKAMKDLFDGFMCKARS